MSKDASKIAKNRKITSVASAVALAAFLLVAGFATVSVTNIASIVEGTVLANKDGVPGAWEGLDNLNNLEVKTSAEVNSDYVAYTTELKNADDSTRAVTHISSYIAEEGTRGGFVPLNEETLEYTYDPSNEKSWTSVKVTEPANDGDGYKLGSTLYLGEEGSNTDTIYFRYSVSPVEEGTVSDTVSFVAQEVSSGELAMVSGESAVEYQKPVATETSSSENTDDPNYAKPLGVSSQASNTAVVNAKTLGAISLSQETVTPSIIAMFVGLGIFAASLIVYLVVHSKNTKKR